MLTDEGLMVVHMQQKSCSSQQLGFLASCPPGVAVVPWVAAIIKLNPTTLPGSPTQINRGKRQKIQKNVSQHILQYSTCIHRSLLNSCKKCLLGVGRCRNWGGGVVIILLLNC